MYYKKIFMEESGCLSYLIGCIHEGTACVVNPKKDVREYLNVAETYNMKITHIFDTRKPEHNCLNGNMELMLRTGAEIYYLNKEASQANGKRVVEKDTFRFGNANLEIIASECNDLYSGMIRVTDTSCQGEPWIILGRDSLFVGDLTDHDLYGEDLSDELSCYLGIHEEYEKTSVMTEPECENLSELKGSNPVYV